MLTTISYISLAVALSLTSLLPNPNLLDVLPDGYLWQARLDKAVRLGPYLGLYFRGRAGAVLGDLPPYEAFPIGGTNSVRGYAGATEAGGEGVAAAEGGCKSAI